MPLFRIIESTCNEEGELEEEPFTQEFTRLSDALSAFRSAEAFGHSWENHMEASCSPLCETGHACWIRVSSRDMYSGENHAASFHVEGVRSPITRKKILKHILEEGI